MWLICSAFAVPAQTPDAEAFEAAVARMEKALDGTDGASYVLYKTEYVDGSMTEEQTLNVQWRKPMDIVIHYDGPQEGRVVLYRGPDWNDGDLRVDPGPYRPVLDLDPDGAVAGIGERYTVREVALSHAVGLVARDTWKVVEHPTWVGVVTEVGTQQTRGGEAVCFDTESQKAEDASFYAYKTRACFSVETGMPTYLQSWDVEDGALRHIETYEFTQIDLTPEQSDATFDPATYSM